MKKRIKLTMIHYDIQFYCSISDFNSYFYIFHNFYFNFERKKVIIFKLFKKFYLKSNEF
jgi:hypothetical protein